jgi:hypothetical protein
MKTAVVSLALLALAGAATAATNAERVIARKSTSGDFADVAASGAATKPAAIRIRVVSTPRQPVQGAWKAVCRKGAGSSTKRGQFRGTTPVVRPVGLPVLRPDRCTVSVSAQLERQGMLTVSILAR